MYSPADGLKGYTSGLPMARPVLLGTDLRDLAGRDIAMGCGDP
jgi:hypothetical protein